MQLLNSLKEAKMRIKFAGKKISGILAIIPDRELLFDDEVDNYEFSKETSMKLKNTMGYNAHRVFEAPICVSDLALYGMTYLFDNCMLDKDDIDALILVTETPDHLMPPTSNIIQGKLELREDMICIDINQGCAGFEIGMFQAFMMLEQDSINKVVLINAEMLSRKVSKQDRNSYPLAGDAATITIVEKDDACNPVYCNVKMDGAGAYAIQIPAGGLRIPCNEETRIERRDEYGNWRSAENLVMKGDEVFMFVQKRVPGLIKDILEFSGQTSENIPYFMFHQPNKFMLNKLADKLKIPRDKMPSNIVENFGNSSSATVPLNIAYNLGDRLCNESMTLCMAGFGVGLVWASIIMEVGPLNFCKIIEHPYNKIVHYQS